MNFDSKLSSNTDTCNNQTISPKYAIAQINIPIEILSNGEWINHNDRITIEMCRISSLPPISNIENKELLNTIEEILGNNFKENEKNAQEEEIQYKISLKSLDDANLPRYFIKEDIKEQNTLFEIDNNIDNLSIISNNIKSESINETIPIHYISREEILKRKQHYKKKNSSFKNIIAKMNNNKTRSNRWNITKDIKGAEC